MDPLTHIVLGGSTSQAFYSHKLGRKGIVLGALAAALPDIDIFPGIFYGAFVGLVAHRGPTHSLWFPFLVGPLLGYLAGLRFVKRNAQSSLTLMHWMGMFTLVLLSHPLLDLCTSYGTQLLAPFSHHRFAIDAIAVIDPLYTLILLISAAIGLWACSRHRQRFALARTAACTALVLSTAYIFYGGILNQKAEAIAASDLKPSGGITWQVHAYPTLLQLYGRRIVARSNDHVCIGFLSLRKGNKVMWQCGQQARDPKIDLIRKTPESKIFEWFAMGMTFATLTPEKDYTLIEIKDLRYGFDRPDQGLWGIQAKVSAQDQILGPITFEEQEVSRELTLGYLKLILLRTFKN